MVDQTEKKKQSGAHFGLLEHVMGFADHVILQLS